MKKLIFIALSGIAMRWVQKRLRRPPMSQTPY